MLRSMYSGISGMRGFQTKLDVISNNIANVNTSGFKKGRVTFQDMMSQTTRGAQGATGIRGGVNPMQVGLGSQIGSIDNIHTQGFRQSTGNPLDFAIEGNGMFVVQEGASTYYTRAGNFYLDHNGTIVNPDGYFLQGFAVEENDAILDGKLILRLDDDGEPIAGTGDRISTYDGNPIVLNGDNIHYANEDGSAGDQIGTITPKEDENGDEIEGQFELTINDQDPKTVEPGTVFDSTTTPTQLQIPLDAQSFSVDTDGVVHYIDAAGIPRVAGQVVLANFSNPAGLEKVGSNLFLDSANAGNRGWSSPNLDGTGSIVASALEMSNVDLAEEFTEMIVAQRGFQANTRIITTSDEILQELVNLKR